MVFVLDVVPRSHNPGIVKKHVLCTPCLHLYTLIDLNELFKYHHWGPDTSQKNKFVAIETVAMVTNGLEAGFSPIMCFFHIFLVSKKHYPLENVN